MTSFPNSLTTTTQDGRNVLHHACAGNNRECAKCLVAAMGISGLCVEDKQLLTPLTLSVHLGHTNLAVEMCRTADVSNLAQLVSGLQSGAASRMTTVITENAGLAAYFEITRAKEEETKSNSHAAPEYSMKSFSKEAVEKPKATETLLPKCLEYRSAQAFTNLALYGTLTPEQVKEVLVGVATLGLHDWPPALSHCGIDLSVENIDGEGHDLLELTAQKGDDVLFRAVWKEYLQTTPKATHCHRLVRALCCVPSLRRCPAELLLAFGLALHELDGGLPPGAADPLLQSTGTSTALWAFATNQGLQPSRKGVIAAAAFCRPAVLQFVLSGGAGLDEDVRLGMLEKALESERKDNALVIVQHCWPDFAVRAREPKNTSLAQKMDAKVKSTKLKQFQADADAQEEVLNNPVLLQEVYQTDADNFFRKLLDRQMLPLKDGSFGVFSWLNARYADTARVKLPSYWNLETEDERGESGFGCLWGSVIRNPSKAPLIAASIGIELETLLCHFSFESVALKRSADPCSTVEDILKSCATDRAVAACVSGLCGAENISVSKWNAVLKFPNVETAVPTMVDAVVNEEDQVTLLMRLLPVPEATNLLDLALSSKSIVRALQKCDRLGRSPAHHLLEKRDAAEESTPEMTEAVHAILTDRLRKIVALCHLFSTSRIASDTPSLCWQRRPTTFQRWLF
ncbi:hypothetical protein AGDE_14415 [Angomonas deanei]|uniref:Ankyrin repeats (3 copies) n=1 Tax=Angomonas deanei TaxID=59799 RepID=A0A7G2CQN3_9TRYP|nr:hypothetical protein AGDE_14415 [Angomonas deanei]CAD2222128.1 hypothetical protein, conserved [Angomonas deanei]|eukprot:EPY20906.1 hypothetical protein AGDE_14415 [Angomonas deanei]